MAEDHLAKRAREARRRLDEAEEAVRGLMEVRAARTERILDLVATLENLMTEFEEKGTVAGSEEVRKEDFEEVLTELEELAKDLSEEANSMPEELRTAISEHNVVLAEAFVEGGKLRSEALKHQATIAAGAIVGVAAITESVMPHPLSAPLLLWSTYAVLLYTVVLSLLLMHVEASSTQQILLSGEAPPLDRWIRWAYTASSMGPTAALLLFIVFQFFNGI